jgi:hypothetical protein
MFTEWASNTESDLRRKLSETVKLPKNMILAHFTGSARVAPKASFGANVFVCVWVVFLDVFWVKTLTTQNTTQNATKPSSC